MASDKISALPELTVPQAIDWVAIVDRSVDPIETKRIEAQNLVVLSLPQAIGVGATPTFAGLTSTGVVDVQGIGDGGLLSYDLKVGDTITPSYGLIQIGNAAIGRISYSAGAIDLDGAVIFRNLGGPVTGEVEFLWTESTGGSTRFALPKSGVGNATYNPRSMLMAGPAPVNTNFVTVAYWQAQGFFHNLACDTVLSGADLGVQNDLEVDGDIFTDSIRESTPGAGISLDNILNYIWAMGGSTKDPRAVLPDDWTEIEIGGVVHYQPAYLL